jgi:YidC/Oxa1 family membrane protein insertase
MILASELTLIPHLVVVAFAWVLAAFYSLVPNYAIAIALFTICVMVLTFPLTRAGTRSMMKQQLIAPEVKKLQKRYKAPPGTGAVERRELQMKMSEELNALYRENGVSMAGGCLFSFLPMPFFFVLYSVVEGMTRTKTIVKGAAGAVKAGKALGKGVATRVVSTPIDIPHSTALYHSIIRTNGRMISFGIDLSLSVRSHHASWVDAIPYAIIVLLAVALQYVQMKQLSGRNAAMAQANPQMQTIQKITPLIFIVFYIYIPAAVDVYFIVSSLFRIGQQEWMYRRDPEVIASLGLLTERKNQTASDTEPLGPENGGQGSAGGGSPKGKGMIGRMLEAARDNAATINGASSAAPVRSANRPAKSQAPGAPRSAGATKRPPPRPGTGGATGGRVGQSKPSSPQTPRRPGAGAPERKTGAKRPVPPGQKSLATGQVANQDGANRKAGTPPRSPRRDRPPEGSRPAGSATSKRPVANGAPPGRAVRPPRPQKAGKSAVDPKSPESGDE